MAEGLKVQKLGSWTKAMRGNPQLGIGKTPKMARSGAGGIKGPKLKPLPAQQGSLVNQKPVVKASKQQRKI